MSLTLGKQKWKNKKNESFIFQPGLLDQEQRFFGSYFEENRAAQLIKKKRKKGKGSWNFQTEKACSLMLKN